MKVNSMRVVALAVAATGLVLVGGRSALRAQETSIKCNLDESVTNELPAGTRVELLLAAGNTAPADRRSSYEQMAHEVVACARDSTHIEILPVTNSGIGMAPVFTRSVPATEHTVPLHAEQEKREFVNDADAAIKAILNTTKAYEHSDLFGTLYAAGDALHRSPTTAKLVVIVIANGWHQTKRIDTFRYHSNPVEHADEIIASLRNDRALPNLAGTVVIMSGFAPGDRNIQMTPGDMLGLCQFWGKVVRASHGSMPLPCEQVLPGLTRPI